MTFPTEWKSIKNPWFQSPPSTMVTRHISTNKAFVVLCSLILVELAQLELNVVQSQFS
jgi:hypothetical protein